jgi:hypothetical protein
MRMSSVGAVVQIALRGCRGSLAIAACIIALISTIAAPTKAAELKRWSFDRAGDRQGWTMPERLTGAVFGGSLWLTPTPKERDPAKLGALQYQVYGDYDVVRRILAGEPREDGPAADNGLGIGPADVTIASPKGLAIAVEPNRTDQLQVSVRILNLSPANNIDFRWRTAGAARWIGRRCALRPDIKEWQELTCYIDPNWSGSIDQIGLGISENVMRGDLWIGRVSVQWGKRQPPPLRPNLIDPARMPRISVPGLTQAKFADAFKVMDDGLVVDVPAYGFSAPFTVASDDKKYGEYAWPYGDSLAGAVAAAWINEPFAEHFIIAAAELQDENPDGRLSGYPWEPVMGQPADINFRPDPYFDGGYAVFQRTNSLQVRDRIYNSLAKELAWYMSPSKMDLSTGLITGNWEEALIGGTSLPPELSGEPRMALASRLQVRSPVDLDAAIVFGADLLADMAKCLHKDADAEHYGALSQALRNSINRYLWNSEKGIYQDYDIPSKRRFDVYTSQTFFALLDGIAPVDRQQSLVTRLTDPKQFNWGRSAILDQPGGSTGDDQGRRAFAHNSKMIELGLKNIGRPDLAAELNWVVLHSFGDQFSEFSAPDGSGLGGKRYAWTAAVFIDGIIDQLFGVEYLGAKHLLRIAPNIPKALWGKPLRIENLTLPNDPSTRMTIDVTRTSASHMRVNVNIRGTLPAGKVEIALPGTNKRSVLASRGHYSVDF